MYQKLLRRQVIHTDSSKVPDLDIVFADKSVLVDVSGTDLLIPSIRHDVAGIPGHAMAVRAGAKRTKHGVMAEIQGKEFYRTRY